MWASRGLSIAICGEGQGDRVSRSVHTRGHDDTTIEREGKTWKLLDTAGIRRRRSVSYGPEYFAYRSFKAVETQRCL